jgi:hypothetical protein
MLEEVIESDCGLGEQARLSRCPEVMPGVCWTEGGSSRDPVPRPAGALVLSFLGWSAPLLLVDFQRKTRPTWVRKGTFWGPKVGCKGSQWCGGRGCEQRHGKGRRK